MRLPLRLNQTRVPSFLRTVLPCSVDPRPLAAQAAVSADRFAEMMTALRFGSTYKTTAAGRHRGTDAEIVRLRFDDPPTILDLGASDGTTSLELLRALDFRVEKYFVTDRNLSVLYQRVGSTLYFYDEDGDCILRVGDRLVVYPGVPRSLPLVRGLADRLIASAPSSRDAMRIELINPEFAAEVGRRENILLRHFSIFDDWVGPRPDLIKIGNLLNRSYFSDEQIRQALSKSLELASPAGYLAVIDNRDRERSTIAGCQEGRWRVIKELNGGTEIRDLLAEFMDSP